MIKYIKQYRFYIILFLFLLIPIVSLDTSNRNPREYRFYDRAIIAMTWPIQIGITWTLDMLLSAFHNYIFLWNTRHDNLLLMQENRTLLNTILNLREAEQENLRFRSLLEFKEKFGFSTIVARVIAKDVSTEFRALRINRGDSDGVKKDMAVLNAEGIVGRVYRTTAHTSDVVTILEPVSAVDAIDKRSRARGVVEGMTEEICQLKFALRTDDIQDGDVLISSGLGGIFPKGIPIGIVSSVKKKNYGITQDIEVRPSVNFSRLEEVLVITHSSPVPIHAGSEPDESGENAP